MRTINLPDTQSGVGRESDHEDQGSNTQGASSTAPPTAQKARTATVDGKPKGANKRGHDSIVTSGHKLHPTRAQKLSQADNDNQSSSVTATFVNGPMLHSVAPKATVGTKPVQNIAVPARPGGYPGGYCTVLVPVGTAAVPVLWVLQMGTAGYCGYCGYCKKWVLRVLQV